MLLTCTTLVSAVMPLDELLILSCWMIVNCFLLKHGAKQCRLYRHFVGRQNVTWLTPFPPKRQNDVILEKIVWRCPLSLPCLCMHTYTSDMHPCNPPSENPGYGPAQTFDMHPPAGYYLVLNRITASRWMHIHLYILASRQVSLLAV